MDERLKGHDTRSEQIVRLSREELNYLTETAWLPEDLEDVVNGARVTNDEGGVLTVDRITAERFRDEFTSRLARYGFNQNYEPTNEGQLLENLIDRFCP